MALVIGARLGPYEIVAPIGAGGMGEVYRARDSKLNRSVAIKVLHAELADDPERLARFQREAEVLASLNHPNIAHLHGLEESDGVRALVMELVEGPTLADLLASGSGLQASGASGPKPERGSPKPVGRGLPLDEALPIARQIAQAMDVAHQQGIVHRDLKPANIKVKEDGTVKVLDFGLAKAVEPVHAVSSSVSMSPTMAMPATMTGVGMILGTAAYMSPEQARGRPTDKRSDVWAFGCVLYEMLTGKRAFDGDDPADALAAIIRGEVDWRALPADLPPQIRMLIERCLVKDRAQRLADMSIVSFLLSEPAALGSAPVAITPSRSRARGSIPWMFVAGLVVAALVTAGVMTLLSRPGANADDRPSRLSIVLPDGDDAETDQLPLAVSADGAALVYVGGRDRTRRLYLRRLDESEARPIAGTEGAKSPFFSPNGRWIGFFNSKSQKLQKVSVGGTAPEVVATAADARGGWWGTDDMIYFAPTNQSPIWRVPASGGGAASQVTQFEPGDISHRWPQLLPDGKTLLWTAWTGPGADEHRIVSQSLKTGERHMLARSADSVRYVPTGHLVYAGHFDDLFMVPWRPGQPDLAGAVPVALRDHVRNGNENASSFAFSDSGLLAFVRGGAARRAGRLVWVDRSGKVEPLPTSVREYDAAAMSPDGRRAVLQVEEGIVGLWMYDFERQTPSPFVTQGGSSQAPVWTPDGKYVFYRGTRKGFRNIYKKAADGSGSEERVTTKADVTQAPTSVSPDGRWLIITETGGTLWKLRLDGDGAPEPFLAAPNVQYQAGQVSPRDGKWIAYTSNESGRDEIWVTSFPEPGVHYQISRDGGDEPRWSRDDRQLFFTTADKLWAVDVQPGAAFAASPPRSMFEGRYRPAINSNTAYDVGTDGRFLRVQQVEPERAVTSIDVVLNWFSELRSVAK